jgi:hypothetical protein
VIGEPLMLKTKYFEPKDNKSGGGTPKRNPANYFIEDDGTLKYEYSVNPNNSANAPAYEITATDKNNLKQKLKVGIKENNFAMVNAYEDEKPR